MRAYLEANQGNRLSVWPPKSWDLRTLTLAALYYSPAIESARDRLLEAQAATITAGARPNPTLSIAPGVPSPYLLALDFNIPVETAGKRGYRIRSARSLDLAARFSLGEAAWKVRSGLRAALLNRLLAVRSVKALRAEEQLRSQQVRLLEERLKVGEVSLPVVDAARLDLARSHLATVAAEGRVQETTAALAGALSVPVSALRGVQLSWPELASPPASSALPASAIRRDAVLNRLDVRRALAEYAAREAQLQLEIAKQYPNLQIGPGYAFEEGRSYFRLGLSAVLPVFNRNQGPIAEAEARRKQAGAVFLQTQAQVLSQSESALARYRSALGELNEIDRSLHTLQAGKLRRTEQAVQVGEEDPLALNGVRLESAVLARRRLATLGRAQRALGALEDALERPLDPGDRRQPLAASSSAAEAPSAGAASAGTPPARTQPKPTKPNTGEPQP